MLDMTVVENAIAFDEKSKSTLMLQMQNLTGLDNPNSVVQMKEWLSDNGIEMDSLGKKEVAGFVKSSDGNTNCNITEALKLRLQLAKSSVKNTKLCKMPYAVTVELTVCSNSTVLIVPADGQAG